MTIPDYERPVTRRSTCSLNEHLPASAGSTLHDSINTSMKINEVTNQLKTYIATVHVAINGAVSTARTTITANNQQQARQMLTRLYGTGNVLSINEVVSEFPRTCEIQAQATAPDRGIHRQRQARKTGPDAISCVSEAGADTRVLSPAELQVKSLADQATRLNQQAKVKKAQTNLLKAQDKLRRASAAPKLSV